MSSSIAAMVVPPSWRSMTHVSYDLLVTGGTLVTSAGQRTADIGVRDGRIAEILTPGTSVEARTVLDAAGQHVLPGVIDTHVHTRHPGVPAREDFLSGTSAAAAGGITTIFEMPISKRPTNSGPALRERAAALQSTAIVDYALYGGAGHENVDAIADQAAAGAIAFKTFLQPPPPTRLDEFTGLWCTDEVRLREVMRAVKATGLRHCFHCEHTATFEALQRQLEAAGRLSGRAHAESRPPGVEELSVAIVLALAEDLNARVQVVHCSSPRAARLARDARWRGVDATVETCPPYLFFTDEALDRLGPFAKCNPPLRGEREVRGLRQCLREGLIEVVGTDHSPFLAEDKAKGAENIFLAPPGLGGLEVLVPLMLTAVHHGWLTLSDVAALLSENAARLFGLPEKGRLQPDADADLTIVDVGARWIYDSTTAITKSRDNMRIYDGVELHGRVTTTVVRGHVVFKDGTVTGQPGHGRFVSPRRA
jgi:allantoinase